MPVPKDTFSKSKDRVFHIVWHNCYYWKSSAKVVRALVDGVVFDLGERTPKSSTIGCARRVFTEDIPQAVPVGTYRYRVVIHFYKNERYPDVPVPLPLVKITIVE